MRDPSLHAAELQRADALLADSDAFGLAQPVKIEAPWWLEAVCWIAMAAITVGTTILLWRI